MNDHQPINLQIDHPDVDDLKQDFQATSIRAHVLSLIHKLPYELLKMQAQEKQVLELGCNKGFGTVIYADAANSIKAVDTSMPAIDYAIAHNQRDNVSYICLDSWTLPFRDNSFDLTVLFQVIEHIALDKLDIFLSEIKRVTRPEGQVVFSTPNRLLRLLPFQKPWNEFHEKEYTARDLKQLLDKYFADVSVDGLFGADALDEVERKRVRQNPAKVYLKNPLRKYLVHPVFKALGITPKKTKGQSSTTISRATGKSLEPLPFSLDDLEYRKGNLKKALDLRAIVTPGK